MDSDSVSISRALRDLRENIRRRRSTALRKRDVNESKEAPASLFASRKIAIRGQNVTQFRSLYRGDCPHFPCSICSRIYRRGETIGEGYETVNYGSRDHLAFYVRSLCRGAFSTRTRHGLLAWKRFRREGSLEWRTAE